MRRVFISHPFSASPERHAAAVKRIARALARDGCLPLAPQIYLPQFVDEATQRDLALQMCLDLVSLSDELRVYGRVTEGMRLEIEAARKLGIPVVDCMTGEKRRLKEEPLR